jgi:hypothetical protein
VGEDEAVPSAFERAQDVVEDLLIAAVVGREVSVHRRDPARC